MPPGSASSIARRCAGAANRWISTPRWTLADSRASRAPSVSRNEQDAFMNDANHIEPLDDTLAALGTAAGDGPFVALNLNRYRRRAEYPAGTPDADVSGREAYLRYGMIAVAAILHTGGRILWAADAAEVVIGCGHDRYDEVVAVWYPSR